MIARLVAAAVGIMLFFYAAAFVLSIIAVGTAVYGLFSLTRGLWRAYSAARDQRRHDKAELLARAEIQHRWFIAGDPRGTYGRFPPAPIT